MSGWTLLSLKNFNTARVIFMWNPSNTFDTKKSRTIHNESQFHFSNRFRQKLYFVERGRMKEEFIRFNSFKMSKHHCPPTMTILSFFLFPSSVHSSSCEASSLSSSSSSPDSMYYGCCDETILFNHFLFPFLISFLKRETEEQKHSCLLVITQITGFSFQCEE